MNMFREPQSRRFVSASLVIGVALIAFGASFGVLAVSAGASVAQATAMSLLIFTGASQMSAVSVIAAGGSVSSAFGGALLLAGRNAAYGLAMAPVLRGHSRVAQWLGAQWVIDETTAMVTAEADPEDRRRAFWISGTILYSSWCAGTFLGALLGTNIDPNDFGLDAAFPVLFIAMLAPHLRTPQGRKAAMFGGVVTVVLAPFLPVGLPILVAALGMLFGLSPTQSKSSHIESDGAP
jgi:4-azaleucine resistance transporter AzlC